MRLIIIINLINIIMLIPFFLSWIPSKRNQYLQNMSMNISWNFGFLITLIGKLGAGKSSSQSALSHSYTVLFQTKILNMMFQTKKIFKHIDFNRLDSYLIECFNNNLDHKEITYLVIGEFNLNNKLFIFNFLEHKSVFDYINDYVFGFYVLNIRNNYVYSITNIYNRITGTFNYKYNLKWQKIYEAYESGDYGISDYAVELIDESTDELGAEYWREDVKDESGAKEYRRKYRHIHQERNRMIDARQDASDMIKRFRTLTQTHLELLETRFVFSYKFIFVLVTLIYKIPLFIYSIFKINIPYIFHRIRHPFTAMSINQYKDHKYSFINFKRNIDNRLLHIEWFFKSISKVVFYAKKYDEADDVGKKDPSLSEVVILHFPASWCFGTYEQFSFKNIQEELINKTKTQSTETNIFFQPNFFNKLNEENKGGDIIDII